MTLPEKDTGVEELEPVAEVQEEEVVEEEDLFAIETGEEEEPDAEVEEEGVEEEGFANEKTEVAFAKRLAKEKEKLRAEITEELRADLGSQQAGQESHQQYGQQQNQQPMNQAQLTNYIDDLATKWATTPEVVWAMYNQQQSINQQRQLMERTQTYMNQLQDNSTKSETKLAIEAQRKANPLLPEWNDAKLSAIRNEYQKKHGTLPTWEDAYMSHVAKEAMAGTLSRQAQQATIKNITKRDRSSVKANKGGAKKPSLDDMSSADFNRLIEDAKEGKFKKN